MFSPLTPRPGVPLTAGVFLTKTWPGTTPVNSKRSLKSTLSSSSATTATRASAVKNISSLASVPGRGATPSATRKSFSTVALAARTKTPSCNPKTTPSARSSALSSSIVTAGRKVLVSSTAKVKRVEGGKSRSVRAVLTLGTTCAVAVSPSPLMVTRQDPFFISSSGVIATASSGLISTSAVHGRPFTESCKPAQGTSTGNGSPSAGGQTTNLPFCTASWPVRLPSSIDIRCPSLALLLSTFDSGQGFPACGFRRRGSPWLPVPVARAQSPSRPAPQWCAGAARP